jgi:hypothetical protein
VYVLLVQQRQEDSHTAKSDLSAKCVMVLTAFFVDSTTQDKRGFRKASFWTIAEALLYCWLATAQGNKERRLTSHAGVVWFAVPGCIVIKCLAHVLIMERVWQIQQPI